MSPTTGMAPMAFVAIILFVVLLAALVNGRMWSAIVGLVGLLLVVGGLLLVGGLLYLSQPVSSRQPPIVRFDGFAGQRHQTIEPLSARLQAERPDQPDGDSLSSSGATRPSSSDANTDEPAGPRRPAWMDRPMGRVDGLYRTRATVGPWMSRTECERELPDVLRGAVATYADHLLGEGKGRFVSLPMSYIHEHIVRGEWEERRQDTIHTMISLHYLLEFDPETNHAIEANYRQSVVQSRLGYLSAGGGALVGLLTIVFGYLKLDTLTRGYYTGRLRLTAATAILVLAVIAGLLVVA